MDEGPSLGPSKMTHQFPVENRLGAGNIYIYIIHISSHCYNGMESMHCKKIDLEQGIYIYIIHISHHTVIKGRIACTVRK